MSHTFSTSLFFSLSFSLSLSFSISLSFSFSVSLSFSLSLVLSLSLFLSLSLSLIQIHTHTYKMQLKTSSFLNHSLLSCIKNIILFSILFCTYVATFFTTFEFPDLKSSMNYLCILVRFQQYFLMYLTLNSP